MEPFKSRRRRRSSSTKTACMYATVLSKNSKKSFNKHAFKLTIRHLWRRKASHNFSITELDNHDNLFLIRFNDALNKARILDGEPWHFDKSLILLKDLNDSYTDSYIDSYRPSNVEMGLAKFWVHVYNLPLMYMTREGAKRIGDFIGQFVDVRENSEGNCWGIALKIRVLIDVRKPLRRVVKLMVKDGEEPIWGSLKYERLPNFCYFCGRLDHTVKECEDYAMEEVLEKKEKLEYGDWMRVKDEPRKRSNNTMDQNGGKKLNFEGENGDDHGRDFASPGNCSNVCS